MKEWKLTAKWKWHVGEHGDQKCAVCRVDFEATCNTGICKFPGDDCPVIRGACKHPFHLHCINKWLASLEENRQEKVCPLCRQVWSINSEDEIENNSTETIEDTNADIQFVLPLPTFARDD
ncbi:unnamed protein product [Oikopleura dioica]|uniref:Anaphase-promoting complex subunit 11 n=1 Tax=Oikopleura dioica TaxID=34765 RepID=E4XXP2_OIKDI|nr:unnamed protein product [Oikopleura dioica]